MPQTDQFLSFEVGSDLTVRDLKEFITAETSIPAAVQSLTVNGRTLSQDTQTLQAAGIQDDDMLAVTARQPQQPPRASQPGGTTAASSQNINAQIETARQQILSQPQAIEQLRRQQPELMDALHDPVRFRELFIASRRAQEAEARQEQQRLARLDDDVNEENQEEIYKRIQQQNIELEYERVMEENPECESCDFSMQDTKLISSRSLRICHNVVHSTRSQWSPHKSFRRLWSSSHHHVTFLRRSLWSESTD